MNATEFLPDALNVQSTKGVRSVEARGAGDHKGADSKSRFHLEIAAVHIGMLGNAEAVRDSRRILDRVKLPKGRH